AAVTVVSPALTAPLRRLHEAGRIRHVARDHRPGDLDGHQLVFVATDDGAVHAAGGPAGRERGVWVHAGARPPHCDFILPAVLRRGELQVAVATGGTSPALSRAIREELEDYFTDDYAALSRLAVEVRQELGVRHHRAGAEVWRRALGADLRGLLAV